MKKPIRFACGPMIQNDQDFISSFHGLVIDTNNLHERWCANIQTLINGVDPNFVPLEKEESDNDFSLISYVQEVPSITTTEKNTTTVVHEDYNHRCYPVNCYPVNGSHGSGVVDAADIAGEKDFKAKKEIISVYNNTIESLTHQANRMLLLKLTTAMADHQYLEWTHAERMSRLIHSIINYNDTSGGCITRITYKTYENPNTGKPVPVFEVCTFVDVMRSNSGVWNIWADIMSGTRIDVRQKLMDKPYSNMTNCDEYLMDDGEVNWSFSFNRDVMTGDTVLILTSCKEIVTGKTYGLTIFNTDFTLDTASNVKMQVPRNSVFRFTAAISRAILGGVMVSLKNKSGISVDCLNKKTSMDILRKYGITIESVTHQEAHGSVYNFAITGQSTDMTIAIKSIALVYNKDFLPVGHSGVCRLQNYTISDGSYTLHGITGNSVRKKYISMMRCIMNLKFKFSFAMSRPYIKAYAIPLGEFDNPNVDITTARELVIEEASIIPISANAEGTEYQFVVSGIGADCLNGNRLLLRFVFGDGAFNSVILDEDKNLSTIANYEFASQYEIDMTNGSIQSSYCGYTFGLDGTNIWNPPIPQALQANALGITEFDYGKFTILNPLDHYGTLGIAAGVNIEDIPTGIPESVNYHSLVLSNPIDESYYFAYVKIPYPRRNTNLGISTPVMKFGAFSCITVTSNVRQLFDIVCERCGYDENNHCAIYMDARLAYSEEGYVLLPVFFSNVDELKIDIEDLAGNPKVTYTIDVNLGPLPLPEEPENPDDSSDDTGDDNNETVKDDNTEPTTPVDPPSSGEGSGEETEDSKDESSSGVDDDGSDEDSNTTETPSTPSIDSGVTSSTIPSYSTSSTS